MTLSPDVLRVLSNVAVNGTRVTITETLDRTLYVAVNKALEALGGKWSRRDKAHVFSISPTDAIDAAILTGTITKERDLLNFFETPEPVVATIRKELAGRNIALGLEPSAGTGALLAAFPKSTTITVVEIEVCRYAVLAARGDVRAFHQNFLSMIPGTPFEAIVMNPPFTKKQDIAHVRHAHRFVARGGILIAVMSAGILFRQDAVTVAFRRWLDDLDAKVTPLPSGSFKSSGTNVETVLVVIRA